MNENDNRKNQTPRRKTFLQTFFGEDTTPAALAKQYGVPVLLAVYALFAVFAMPHCTRLKDAPSEDASFTPPAAVTTAPKAAATPEPTPTPEPKEPTFTNATLAYAGDLVVHMGLNEEAHTAEGYDFKPVMEGAIPYVQDADYAFCCFETTFPIEGDISGYPTFHSPVSLATNLKEAGFEFDENGKLSSKTPLHINYLTNEGTGHEGVAQALQQDFAQIGITMDISVEDWQTFLNDRKSGNFDVAREGWLADYDDPINMLEMFTSDSGNNDMQLGK